MKEGVITPAKTKAEYLKSLYFKEGQPPLPYYHREERITIDDDLFDHSVKKLSSGKACGIDKLKDVALKRAINNSEELRAKVKSKMESWLNGD